MYGIMNVKMIFFGLFFGFLLIIWILGWIKSSHLPKNKLIDILTLSLIFFLVIVGPLKLQVHDFLIPVKIFFLLVLIEILYYKKIYESISETQLKLIKIFNRFLSIVYLFIWIVSDKLKVESSIISFLSKDINQFLLTGIVPVIAEEIIFRVIILEKLIHLKVGPIKSNIIQSFLFMLIHISQYTDNIKMIIGAFIFSMFFGYIQVRYKNILIPIIIHFGINFSFYLIIGFL